VTTIQNMPQKVHKERQEFVLGFLVIYDKIRKNQLVV